MPAMEPHGLRNVGDERVRVAGFFSSNVIVSTFDQPVMPFGQRVVGTPPVLAEDEVPSGDAGVLSRRGCKGVAGRVWPRLQDSGPHLCLGAA